MDDEASGLGPRASGSSALGGRLRRRRRLRGSGGLRGRGGLAGRSGAGRLALGRVVLAAAQVAAKTVSRLGGGRGAIALAHGGGPYQQSTPIAPGKLGRGEGLQDRDGCAAPLRGRAPRDVELAVDGGGAAAVARRQHGGQRSPA